MPGTTVWGISSSLLGLTSKLWWNPVKKTGDVITHILAYHVDDALIMGKGGDQIVKEIAKVVPMKNLGRPTKNLGVEFKYLPSGDLKLSPVQWETWCAIGVT